MASAYKKAAFRQYLQSRNLNPKNEEELANYVNDFEKNVWGKNPKSERKTAHQTQNNRQISRNRQYGTMFFGKPVQAVQTQNTFNRALPKKMQTVPNNAVSTATTQASQKEDRQLQDKKEAFLEYLRANNLNPQSEAELASMASDFKTDVWNRPQKQQETPYTIRTQLQPISSGRGYGTQFQGTPQGTVAKQQTDHAQNRQYGSMFTIKPLAPASDTAQLHTELNEAQKKYTAELAEKVLARTKETAGENSERYQTIQRNLQAGHNIIDLDPLTGYVLTEKNQKTAEQRMKEWEVTATPTTEKSTYADERLKFAQDIAEGNGYEAREVAKQRALEVGKKLADQNPEKKVWYEALKKNLDAGYAIDQIDIQTGELLKPSQTMQPGKDQYANLADWYQYLDLPRFYDYNYTESLGQQAGNKIAGGYQRTAADMANAMQADKEKIRLNQTDKNDPFLEVQYIRENPQAYYPMIAEKIIEYKAGGLTDPRKDELIALIESGVKPENIMKTQTGYIDKTKYKLNRTDTASNINSYVDVLATLGVTDAAVELAAETDEGTQQAQQAYKEALTGNTFVDTYVTPAAAEGLAMLPNVAVSMVPGGKGARLTGKILTTINSTVRGYGAGAEQARGEGATRSQQILQGAASAAAEAVTERIALDKIFKVSDTILERNFKNAAKRIGVSMLTEGSTEALSDVLQNASAKYIYKPDMEWFSTDKEEDAVINIPQLFDTFVISAALGGGMGAGNYIGQARYENAAHKATQDLINNPQAIADGFDFQAGATAQNARAVIFTDQKGNIGTVCNEQGQIMVFAPEEAARIKKLQKEGGSAQVRDVDISQADTVQAAYQYKLFRESDGAEDFLSKLLVDNGQALYNETRGDANGEETALRAGLQTAQDGETDGGRFALVETDGRVGNQNGEEVRHNAGGTSGGNEHLVVTNPSIQREFASRNITPVELKSVTDSNAFSNAIVAAKQSNDHGAFVTAYSPEEYDTKKLFLSDDGYAGVAVTEDGDIESVFKNGNSKVRGAVSNILLTAIDNGGIKLDNYDSKGLSKMYAAHGFIPVSKVKFDPRYAPDDWNYDIARKDGQQPDIVFWIHNGDLPETVAQKISDYDAVDTSNIPVFDTYDQAQRYRDMMIGDVQRRRRQARQTSAQAQEQPTISMETTDTKGNAQRPEVKKGYAVRPTPRGEVRFKQASETVMNNLSRADAKRVREVEKLAKDLGLPERGVKLQWDADIEVYDGADVFADNGFYDSKEKVLHISLDAENGAYRAVLLHEMSHMLEGTAAYRQIQTIAVRRLKEAGVYESMMREYGELYGADEQTYIEQEIVADEVARICNEPAYARVVARGNRGIINKLLNALDTIKARHRLGKEAAAQFESLRALLQNALEENADNSTAIKHSKKLGGYFPDVEVSTDGIASYFGIRDIRQKNQVINKVTAKLADSYLSTAEQSKPITNIDTGMKVEIRKSGIRETFGNDKYYLDLSDDLKLAKIASMKELAKLIKYGEVRAPEASNYHNPNSPARYAYLIAPLRIDGVDYDVTMDIRRIDKGDRFYIHKLNIKEGRKDTSKPQRGLINDWQALSSPERSAAGIKSSQALHTDRSSLSTRTVAQEGADVNSIRRGTENDTLRESRKRSKLVDTVQQSEAVSQETKDSIEVLKESGFGMYDVKSNRDSVERARAKLDTFQTDEQAQAHIARMSDEGKRLSAEDVAFCVLAVNRAGQNGHAEMAQKMIADMRIAITDQAQAIQAAGIFKKMDKTGRLYALEKTRDRLNEQIRKNGGKTKVALAPHIVQELMDASTRKEGEAIEKAALTDMAGQVPAKLADKLTAWRYMSMLSNPRTHIRNITGNVLMYAAVSSKNIAGALMEGAAAKFNPNMERTKTLQSLHTSKGRDALAFAKQDAQNQYEFLTNDGKEGARTTLNEGQRIFKNRVLEFIRDKNGDFLEKEDAFFITRQYQNALAKYMLANGLSASDLQNSPAKYARARDYAANEAWKATFHDASKLAAALNKFEKSGPAAKLIVGGVMPFKKTPINVLKRGVEYSPLGLIDGLMRGSVALKQGKINANEYIDRISAGLTGTMVSALGAFLASIGVLRASGADNDDEEYFERMRGEQPYSLRIGGMSFTIDWAAPICIPLFVGCEAFNVASKQDNAGAAIPRIIDAFANASDPMLQLSCLQGVNDAIDSFSKKDALGALGSFASTTAANYISQFIPTIFGQTARTIDPTRRTTYAAKDSAITQGAEKFLRKLANKIPFLNSTLQPYVDQWGNLDTGTKNIVVRSFEQYLFPWYQNEIEENDTVNREIERLYANTGDASVLPKMPSSTIQIGKENEYVPSEHIANYQKVYGEKARSVVQSLMSSSIYRGMDDSERVEAIASAYTYAKEYAKQNGSKLPYKITNSWVLNAMDAEKRGIPIATYILVRQQGNDIEGVKDKNGQTINGTKKANRVRYLNTLPLTTQQKQYILTNMWNYK